MYRTYKGFCYTLAQERKTNYLCTSFISLKLAAFLCAKLMDKIYYPQKIRNFSANLIITLKLIIMADFESIMAMLLLVLNALLFMVEIVYYVVKTAKELY